MWQNVRRIRVVRSCPGYWLWWHLSPERLGAAALALFEERRSPLLLSRRARGRSPSRRPSGSSICRRPALAAPQLPSGLARLSR